jgi:hypothetical protein
MKIEISLDTKDAADLAALMALVGSLGGSVAVPGAPFGPDGTRPFDPEVYLSRFNLVAADEPEGGISTGAPVMDDTNPELGPLPNPEGAPDVDSRGLPWDERIHAGTKATNADGSWRNKRGVDKALLEAVEAELAGGAVPNAPDAPAATASGADVAEGASEVPLPPAPAAEEAAGTIPDAPAAPTPADAPTFKDAMAIVTTRQREGTLTQVQVSEAAQALGLSSVVDLAKPANAEHIAAFIALLG